MSAAAEQSEGLDVKTDAVSTAAGSPNPTSLSRIVKLTAEEVADACRCDHEHYEQLCAHLGLPSGQEVKDQAWVKAAIGTFTSSRYSEELLNPRPKGRQTSSCMVKLCPVLELHPRSRFCSHHFDRNATFGVCVDLPPAPHVTTSMPLRHQLLLRFCSHGRHFGFWHEFQRRKDGSFLMSCISCNAVKSERNAQSALKRKVRAIQGTLNKSDDSDDGSCSFGQHEPDAESDAELEPAGKRPCFDTPPAAGAVPTDSDPCGSSCVSPASRATGSTSIPASAPPTFGASSSTGLTVQGNVEVCDSSTLSAVDCDAELHDLLRLQTLRVEDMLRDKQKLAQAQADVARLEEERKTLDAQLEHARAVHLNLVAAQQQNRKILAHLQQQISSIIHTAGL